MPKKNPLSVIETFTWTQKNHLLKESAKINDYSVCLHWCSTRKFCIFVIDYISWISLANWWHQGKHIFAKVLAFQNSFLSMYNMTQCNIASAFSETISCRCFGRWHFFKQWRFNWVQEPRLQEEKKKKPLFGNTSELLLSRNSLNWFKFFNEIF